MSAPERPVVPRPLAEAGHDVRLEHAALTRHLACLQTRVSEQCNAQIRRCDALEAELVRWRARWVVACTQLLWGLGWPGLGATAGSLAERRESAMRRTGGTSSEPLHAAAVLCQSGCASHAHPWRKAEGLCLLTGDDCTRAPSPDPRYLSSTKPMTSESAE